MGKRVLLLDATLRDGGFAFEDAAKNNIADHRFDQNVIASISENLTDAQIDIIELGAIEITQQDMRHCAIYQNVEEISKAMPKRKAPHQMYAALYRGPDTPVEDIPDWNPSLCEGIRVILRYSELQKSLDFCSALSRKGYKVFVQPMLTMRYSDEDIRHMIRAANDMHAYALYFVDSYGYMQEDDIEHLFNIYDEGLLPEIKIGFHPHNNMSLAFANAKCFLSQQTDRELIIDACAMGLGQGAGNLQTEIIADHMMKQFNCSYRYEKVLEVCESVGRYWTNNTWGYSVLAFLPARHRAAYKYAVAMRHHHAMSFSEIDRILSSMPYDLKQRYTPQNLEAFLDVCKQK